MIEGTDLHGGHLQQMIIQHSLNGVHTWTDCRLYKWSRDADITATIWTVTLIKGIGWPHYTSMWTQLCTVETVCKAAQDNNRPDGSCRSSSAGDAKAQNGSKRKVTRSVH